MAVSVEPPVIVAEPETRISDPVDVTAFPEDVADSCSAACWSVQDLAWEELVPGLSDEMIALLAPPVLVSAQSLTGA